MTSTPTVGRVQWLARLTLEVAAGLTLVVALTTSVGVSAQVLDLSVTGQPGGRAVVLLAVAAGLLFMGFAARSGAAVPRSFTLVALPSLSVLAVGTASLAAGSTRAVEWFLNGDHPRHLVFVVDTWHDGNLDYAAEPYPRAWHFLLASLWNGPSDGDFESVRVLMSSMAGASLLLSAVICVGYASLALELMRVLGVAPGASGVGAAVVAGTLTMTFALANYQALGFEASLLAAAVLAGVGREVVVRPGTTSSVIVTAAASVVLAHTWQLLLAGAVAAWCFCAWRHVASRQGFRAPVVTGAWMLLASTPGLMAAARDIGLTHAGVAGPLAPVPLPVLFVGCVIAGAAPIAWRARTLWMLAFLSLVPVATALLLVVTLGVARDGYYPNKLAWHACLFAVVWLVSAATFGVGALMRRAERVTPWLQGVVAAGVALFLVYAVIQPWGALLGVWSTVEGERVLSGLAAPGADRAQVVWLQRSATTDAVTRSFLDAYRAGSTRERAPQSRLTITQECLLLAGAPEAVVLTTAPEAEARARYGCVPDAVLIRVVVADG